jgi:hypothetical protein
MTAARSRVPHRTQPSALVATPAYLSPEAKITNAIAGRT